MSNEKSVEEELEYFKSLGIPKDVLDDAIVIYHETRPPEVDDVIS